MRWRTELITRPLHREVPHLRPTLVQSPGVGSSQSDSRRQRSDRRCTLRRLQDGRTRVTESTACPCSSERRDRVSWCPTPWPGLRQLLPPLTLTTSPVDKRSPPQMRGTQQDLRHRMGILARPRGTRAMVAFWTSVEVMSHEMACQDQSSANCVDGDTSRCHLLWQERV